MTRHIGLPVRNSEPISPKPTKVASASPAEPPPRGGWRSESAMSWASGEASSRRAVGLGMPGANSTPRPASARQRARWLGGSRRTISIAPR
jgi:hypothetical protein